MSDTPKTDAQKRGDFVHINFARELERENVALREDKERLDWLEGQIRCGFYNHATGRTELSALSCHHVKTIGIRAVIDSKREKAQP